MLEEWDLTTTEVLEILAEYNLQAKEQYERQKRTDDLNKGIGRRRRK
jgi:hypothetical protein